MKTILLSILVVSAVHASPKKKKQTMLPQDATEWIMRFEHCHEADEYSKELEKFRCSELDSDEAQLTKKYKSDKRVLKAIEEVVVKHKIVD